MKAGLCPAFIPPKPPFFVGAQIQEQGECNCPGQQSGEIN
jgi:hypothetical protein